jgi:hypothetical protein
MWQSLDTGTKTGRTRLRLLGLKCQDRRRMSVKGVIDARCHGDRKSKASEKVSTRLARARQASIRNIFSAPTRNLSAKFAHLHMQMPAKEHGPRSVNAHSVICAFVLLTNRDSPTSSCILARIRPVKIAPWSHSHTTSRQTPTSRPRVYVVLAEPIHRRTFSHQCIIFF